MSVETAHAHGIHARTWAVLALFYGPRSTKKQAQVSGDHKKEKAHGKQHLLFCMVPAEFYVRLYTSLSPCHLFPPSPLSFSLSAHVFVCACVRALWLFTWNSVTKSGN